MVEIIKQSEEQFWVKVSETSFLNRITGIDIKNRLINILGDVENCTIIIDLHGVNEINADGYHQLIDAVHMAATSNCKIQFSNISEEIDELICNLTETSES